MTKHLTLMTFASMILGSVCLNCTLDAIPGHLAIAPNDQETRQKLEAHNRFRSVLIPTIDALSRGQIRLRDACDRVCRAAELHSPTYFSLVPRSDPGRCLHESIARNLLAHVRDRAEFAPELCPYVSQVELELQEIVEELDHGPVAIPTGV